MNFNMKIEQTYLAIPIWAGQPEEVLEIYAGEEKIYEFQIPVCKDVTKINYDYCSYLNIKEYQGHELTLKGTFQKEFFERIYQTEDSHYIEEKRPLLHFTAKRGWLNDPNGLVYQNGQYHLYFQYNPMNTEWQNMSWGHSVSEDMLHFEQLETVMYPDEHGAVFSGCGLVNERGLLGLPKDALLFFYSAAGGFNQWSEGKAFTQRVAYSLDGGKTLIKMPDAAIDVIEQDTRDPKIIWHEETGAYIMVLWLRGNEFGFFRSDNLKNWMQTDTVCFPKAWECPDFYKLDCEGEEVWVFTSADGFYYLGEFDGYKFITDGVRKLAYMTPLPYAAQTFSGITDRVISIPWLRTKNTGRLYTGMMGMPRELKLVNVNGEKLLSMLPIKEYEESRKKITSFDWAGKEFAVSIPDSTVVEVELWPESSDFEEVIVSVYDEEVSIRGNVISYKDKAIGIPEELKEIHILVDREIIEIYMNHGTRNVYFETGSTKLKGSINMKGFQGKGNIYTWQP